MERSMMLGRRALGRMVVAAAALVTCIGVPDTTEAIGASTRLPICHWVGEGRWIGIEPSASSLLTGHAHHPHDIIPAFVFEQGRRDVHFGGHNLGPILPGGITGQQVLDNGCRLPPAATASPTTTTRPSTTPAPTPAPTVATTTLAPDTAPDPSTPTTSTTAVPDTLPTTTLAPQTAPDPSTPTTSTTAVPDTLPTTTLAPQAAPNGVPTTAPYLTPRPTTCADDEFEHEGACFRLPPLVLALTPPLQTSTSSGDPTPTPLVECVTRIDDQIVTWFGYELDADGPVRIDRGARNRVETQGDPPTLFGPGLHVRVLAAVGERGDASWTLGDVTVSSGADTPDCEDPVAPTTIAPDSTVQVTTTPDATTPATSSPDATTPDATTPETGQPTDTSPDETRPEGTTPDTVTDSSQPTCDPADAGCPLIRAVELVLVDNYLECDGHAVARFAAFNTNGFALGGPGFVSDMSPSRLSEFAPEVIGDTPIASVDGTELAEFVDVRYITAVTWAVEHDGFATSISAGVSGARTNPACPNAHIETTGLDGFVRTPIDLATTGGDQRTATYLGVTFIGLGTLLLGAARRRRST